MKHPTLNMNPSPAISYFSPAVRAELLMQRAEGQHNSVSSASTLLNPLLSGCHLLSPAPFLSPLFPRVAKYSGQFSFLFLLSLSSLKPLISTSFLKYSLYWISGIPHSGFSPTSTGCFSSISFISSVSFPSC